MIGRLTRDPELRRTNSGTSVGAFSIACNDGRRGPNGEEQTVFIDCTLFGKQAETLVKFFKKGNLIGLTGRLTQRKFVNRDNVQVTRTEITVDRIEFVEPAKERDDSGFTPDYPGDNGSFSQVDPVAETKNVDAIDVTDDDLPF
jgi:single-strand DNA-binding protein